MRTLLKAPFPAFGGKARIAAAVWERLGVVPNYVETHCNSAAVLLANPTPARHETINDIDGFIVNFWRAVRADPDAVAHHADWPVTELDLRARHVYLCRMPERDEFIAKLVADPDFFDARRAGWWAWGASLWIGRGWCHFEVWNGDCGPWEQLPDVKASCGVLSAPLGKKPFTDSGGRGVNIGDAAERAAGLREWMRALAVRLRGVRVLCGDWSRVLTPAVTFHSGLTAVFIDPPYTGTPVAGSDALYRDNADPAQAAKCAAWARAMGCNEKLRIAICGLSGDYEFPPGWECLGWSAKGGFGNQNRRVANEARHAERIWFSPHCLKPGLFHAD